eukprot:PhF_6_TR9512/c0_g1_i2/m.14826
MSKGSVSPPSGSSSTNHKASKEKVIKELVASMEANKSDAAKLSQSIQGLQSYIKTLEQESLEIQRKRMMRSKATASEYNQDYSGRELAHDARRALNNGHDKRGSSSHTRYRWTRYGLIVLFVIIAYHRMIYNLVMTVWQAR